MAAETSEPLPPRSTEATTPESEMGLRGPTVAEFMTPAPHTIGYNQTLTAAHRLMREHRIRHLPVLKGGKLVGLVSERDLHLVETLREVDPDRVTVEEAMSSEPFTVSPDTPVETAASIMADQKYGSAVVVDRDQVVGIFTTTDALRATVELVRRLRAQRP